MISVVREYNAIFQNLSKIIDVSGYRNDYVAKKLGIKPQHFSVKKQRGSWTPQEVEKLLSIIENEDVNDFIEIQLSNSRAVGNTLTADEFEKEMGWK